MRVEFYLGTHMPSWIGRTNVPLFISHRRLIRQHTWQRAIGSWALDSGGFTEISQYGEWRTSPAKYVERVAVYAEEIGRLAWAAPQDWMCEPWIVQRTGLSVLEHQRRTIDNFLLLKQSNNLFIPVVQGWELRDYIAHIGMYAAVGIDLAREELVGIGSVCRRQNTDEARDIFKAMSEMGLTTHGFGVKTSGFQVYGEFLKSADSMAWSYTARKQNIKLEDCAHARCQNCLIWALQWRERLISYGLIA